MIQHAPSCHCGRCYDSLMRRLKLAIAEENAGRENAHLEAKPRPGTFRALHKAYGPIGKGHPRRLAQ